MAGGGVHVVEGGWSKKWGSLGLEDMVQPGGGRAKLGFFFVMGLPHAHPHPTTTTTGTFALLLSPQRPPQPSSLPRAIPSSAWQIQAPQKMGAFTVDVRVPRKEKGKGEKGGGEVTPPPPTFLARTAQKKVKLLSPKPNPTSTNQPTNHLLFLFFF